MVKRHLLISVLTVVVIVTAWMFPENGNAADNSYIQLTRISFMEGNVSYQRVPDEEWAAMGVNMPLEPGDRIYTGPGGRAEIEFEEGSVLRLAENTDIEILTLGEDFVQIRMVLGLASLAVEKGVDFEIATPSAAFITQKDGIYRFEVAEDDSSVAVVRSGKLEAVNDNFSRSIGKGDLLRAYPDMAGPLVTDYRKRDAWDEWTDRRSADRQAMTNHRYLPSNVHIGVRELDRHGRWVYVSAHGWGWAPHSVGSYWSPYSAGRWVYRPRFGWTWVSTETWGWLPYHYGRWYRDASIGWCWFPGNSVSFSFWSPGLVAFYRGPGWVSWGPLGPGDYYNVSWYHYRRIHANDLARMRALAVRRPGDFINRNTHGAFRTVDVNHFHRASFNERSTGGSRGNHGNIDQPWKHGELVRGRLDIRPTRESYRPAPERHAVRPTRENSRPVVVRQTPTRAAGNHDRFRPVANSRIGSAASRPNTNAERRSVGDGRRSEEQRLTPSVRTNDTERGRPARQQQVQPQAQRTNQNGNRAQATVTRPATPSTSRSNARESDSRRTATTPATRENRPSTVRGNSSQSQRPSASVATPRQSAPGAAAAPATGRNNAPAVRDNSSQNQRPATSATTPRESTPGNSNSGERSTARDSARNSSRAQSGERVSSSPSSSGSQGMRSRPSTPNRSASSAPRVSSRSDGGRTGGGGDRRGSGATSARPRN